MNKQPNLSASRNEMPKLVELNVRPVIVPLPQPHKTAIGGVTGSLRVASLAQTKGIQLSSHLWPEISAQLMCLTPTAHWLEYSDWWNSIIAEPLQIQEGMAIVGEALGTGVAWNEGTVSQFAI